MGSGNTSATFSTAVGSATIAGKGGTSQTINFSSGADLATFDGTLGAGSIVGGAGNDTLTFLAAAAVNASTVVKLDGGNDKLTFKNNILSGQFGGGAGDDFVSGSVFPSVTLESASGVVLEMTPSASTAFQELVVRPTSGMRADRTPSFLAVMFLAVPVLVLPSVSPPVHP